VAVRSPPNPFLSAFLPFFLSSPGRLLQEKTKSELPSAGMKLIHSGKVLKDEAKVSECGIKPNDFLVVMVTKPKAAAAAKPAAAAAAAATTPKAAEEAGKTPAAAASGESKAAEEAKTPAPPPAAAASDAAAAETAQQPPPAPTRDSFPDSVVENLTAMGFPEAEVRHCLRAAQGNPDIAVEFLTNGIPEAVAAAAAAAGSGSPSTTSPQAGTSSSSSGGQQQPTLQALRNHPQFDDLRRLVQSNPQMLQQVLSQIGQQQPELLQEINANQALFLQMMNEPIEPSSSGSGSGGRGAGSGAAAAAEAAAAGGGFPGGLGSPGQMAQMIQNMSSEEVNQMAAMMGISPDQLRQTAQMIGSMPPEQLNQFMMQAMAGGGGGDAEGLAGLMGGGGGGAGQQVLRLSEEEMAAVDRLTDMGFDRAEAAQAYLACDKNEALAANLLMDSMDTGGGFFGGGGGGGGGSGGDNDDNGGNGDGDDNNGGDGNDNDDEEMYD